MGSAATRLPNELCLAIFKNLDSLRDLAACAETCVAWSSAATARLYYLEYPNAIFWAITKGDNGLLDKIRTHIEDPFWFEDLSLAIINDNTSAAEAVLSSPAVQREWGPAATKQIPSRLELDECGRVPLVAAVARRNKHLVGRILSIPEIAKGGRDHLGSNALEEACSSVSSTTNTIVAAYKSYTVMRSFNNDVKRFNLAQEQDGEADLDIVRMLLDAGHDASGAMYGSPLYAAARSKRVDIMELLLARGADPDVGHDDLRDDRPLIGAASVAGNVEAVRLLLKHGANATRVGYLAGTPLHCAADAEIAAELLRATGQPLEYQPGRGDVWPRGALRAVPRRPHVTALMAAVESGRLETVVFLLEKGADPHTHNSRRYNTLGAAAWADRPDVVPALVAAGLDPLLPVGNGYMCARQAAAHRGSLGVLKKMISMGIDFAALPKAAAVPRYLTDSTTHTHRLPICLAPNIATFEVLASCSGSFNDRIGPNDETVFMQAMVPRGNPTRDLTGWRDIVRRYVELGASLEAVDNAGQTVLHKAVRFSDEDRVDELVKLGAEVDRVDNDGWTPLMLACERGHEEIARVLIQAGADATGISRANADPRWISRDGEGCALDMAVHRHLTRTLRDMILAGADLDAAFAWHDSEADARRYLERRIGAIRSEAKCKAKKEERRRKKLLAMLMWPDVA